MTCPVGQAVGVGVTKQEHALETRDGAHVVGMYDGIPVVAVRVEVVYVEQKALADVGCALSARKQLSALQTNLLSNSEGIALPLVSKTRAKSSK